jgi:hypothetical protein
MRLHQHPSDRSCVHVLARVVRTRALLRSCLCASAAAGQQPGEAIGPKSLSSVSASHTTGLAGGRAGSGRGLGLGVHFGGRCAACGRGDGPLSLLTRDGPRCESARRGTSHPTPARRPTSARAASCAFVRRASAAAPPLVPPLAPPNALRVSA